MSIDATLMIPHSYDISLCPRFSHVLHRDDMENAIRKLDDTEFKNHNDSAYIRVKGAKGGRG